MITIIVRWALPGYTGALLVFPARLCSVVFFRPTAPAARIAHDRARLGASREKRNGGGGKGTPDENRSNLSENLLQRMLSRTVTDPAHKFGRIFSFSRTIGQPRFLTDLPVLIRTHFRKMSGNSVTWSPWDKAVFISDFFR